MLGQPNAIIALLDNRWVRRGGAVTFLVSVLSFIVGLLQDWGVLLVVAAVVAALNAALLFAIWNMRRRFDPDALANDLDEAVAGASALIEGRWATIPKTGPSHPRTDFGNRHYEAATLGKYKEQYQARLNTLVSTARQHRRATAAEALAGRVYDLDDFWVFMSLLSQVIRRLRGDGSARPIQKKRDDQIAQLQKWGWEVAQAIQRGTLADGRLEQIPKTPYQGFSEWWHEAALLLGDRLDKPTRSSTTDEVVKFIERGIKALENRR